MMRSVMGIAFIHDAKSEKRKRLLVNILRNASLLPGKSIYEPEKT